ncbi:restriction endonuclease [Halorubrum sp. DTA98]|uniref:restriction endonuclease n=1 Tax=Halorubrum sp. DTA98 TaxID=3402163 RepID=UPI003AAEA82C
MATVLDDLSGFEFEAVMVDVFRHQGYRDVRQAVRTADEGRDVTMIDDSGPGEPVGVVVECKHTDAVGRPVVQKLHSAVTTYDYDGPCRGVVATTGRFTAPAQEYAKRVSDAPDDIDIDLLDGRRLREIGEEIGMDLYSGRIEVLCEETLPPPTDVETVTAERDAAAATVENLSSSELPVPDATLAFSPTLLVDTAVDATFETSVGVIHSVSDRERLAISADRDGPALLRSDAARLIDAGIDRAVPIPDGDEAVDERFAAVEFGRFGRTESEYVDWVVDRQRDRYERTVTYTGDNNVTYERTCTPTKSDVRVTGVEPVFLPQATTTTRLGEYEYGHAFVTNGDERLTVADEFGTCVHCDRGSDAGGGRADVTITHCDNCGSLNCADHVREERLVGEPVCTGCSTTGEFFLATKHFYDEANREAFAGEYAAMPVYRKPLENPKLVAGVAVGVLILLVVLFGAV